MEHGQFTVNVYDMMRAAVDLSQPLMTVFTVLLVIAYARSLYIKFQHMLRDAVDSDLADIADEKAKRKQKPIESELSESDDLAYEKPKRNAWRLGDDGELIEVDQEDR